MSTNTHKRRSAGDRFALLAKTGETVFHTGDLANLWGIVDKNTLLTTISRYVKRELMYRIQKGMYSINKVNNIDAKYLGLKAIHAPAYISCETVLYTEGIINQPPVEIAIVSSVSKHFSVSGIKFRSRKMSDEFLFNDAGVMINNNVRAASIERAVADMLYFNRKKYFDANNSSLLKWHKVREIAVKIGYKINLPKHVTSR